MKETYAESVRWGADMLRDNLAEHSGPHADAALDTIARWLARGDGVAVYEDRDLSSTTLGAWKLVSFGSAASQLETDQPPIRLPDIGEQINWRYVLVGTYRVAEEEQNAGTSGTARDAEVRQDGPGRA